MDQGENPGETCLWSSVCRVKKGQNLYLMYGYQNCFPLYSSVLFSNLHFRVRPGTNCLVLCVPSSIEGSRALCDADQRTGCRSTLRYSAEEHLKKHRFLLFCTKELVCESLPSASFVDVCCSVSEHYDGGTAFSTITRRESGCRSEAGEGSSGRLLFIYSC